MTCPLRPVLRIANSDDVFLFHVYGEFQDTFTPLATINATIDCGSHCEMYGHKPGEVVGESDIEDLCDMIEIEQPTGGKKKNVTCPPEPGYALITGPGYAWPMLFHTVVSVNSLLRVKVRYRLTRKGWYNLTFDAKTAEGDRIFCLTAEVCLRYAPGEEKNHYGGPYGPWSNCTWPR